MIQKGFKRACSEFNALSWIEKIFILFATGCSFLITMEASITKAISNSLFLGNFGVNALPYAWIAAIPLNLLIVSIYNRFLPQFGCFKMLAATTFLSIAINSFASFFIPRFPVLAFAFYVWKDIYIMMLFQQLWSVLHATISMKKAKYLYGVFYGMGGIGSLIGSMIPGFLAIRFGTEKLLLITIPFYLLLTYCYYHMLHIRDRHPEMQRLDFDKQSESSFKKAGQMIFRSRFLVFILLIVIAMQLSSTLLDFKFNYYVSQFYPIKDIRTEYLGRFFGMINGINVLLQFLGSFIFIHLLGVRKTHFLIPLFLGISTLGLTVIPTFGLIAFTYGSIKAIDYSIFGIAKEMLYIPLSKEHKFQAKAVIDVFAYRTSKAFASLFILVLEFFYIESIQYKISWILCVIFAFWLFAIFLIPRHSEQTSVDLT